MKLLYAALAVLVGFAVLLFAAYRADEDRVPDSALAGIIGIENVDDLDIDGDSDPDSTSNAVMPYAVLAAMLKSEAAFDFACDDVPLNRFVLVDPSRGPPLNS
jgi:hypothetical protein